MDEFIDCISTCGVTDIVATGAFFNWTNELDPTTRVFSRLDRFMVNQEWLNQFPNMVAHFHPEGLFNHCPCTVSNVSLGDGIRASFKYFNMWGKATFFLPEFETAATLKELTVARDSFLSQKAKSKWLEAGDSNTAYFHGAIKKRVSMNKVIQIEDQYGTVFTE
ncbi:uncharacterized protein LOC141607753 [Silene latifolia]|uniref:uncharacterized protein LOC141607753 n=1 Tax=Silene latifolia TaxID=37657 RepID=UPI003D77E737